MAAAACSRCMPGLGAAGSSRCGAAQLSGSNTHQAGTCPAAGMERQLDCRCRAAGRQRWLAGCSGRRTAASLHPSQHPQLRPPASRRCCCRRRRRSLCRPGSSLLPSSSAGSSPAASSSASLGGAGLGAPSFTAHSSSSLGMTTMTGGACCRCGLSARCCARPAAGPAGRGWEAAQGVTDARQGRASVEVAAHLQTGFLQLLRLLGLPGRGERQGGPAAARATAAQHLSAHCQHAPTSTTATGAQQHASAVPGLACNA